MRALVIVDVQPDFCPGGSLATERGDHVARLIGGFVDSDVAQATNYAAVVATQDWHIDPGSHFSDEPDFVDSWPRHCVAHTEGAELHPALRDVDFDALFKKGQYEAAYSGFEGTFEGESLAHWLRSSGITAIDVAGIATDFCVRATVLDGLKENFEVRVLTGMCSAVDPQRGDAALAEMEAAGAQLI
ncbi:nicotinamidase [Corynebacterium tapiri]|uniref:nicotinamidase n=2 Tax=Corynebacterium tapiri TaxID=1448266 RepID=A0A5C4U3Q7_9CORY|nr:nicotinamidase [Corynebacterium tapiri]